MENNKKKGMKLLPEVCEWVKNINACFFCNSVTVNKKRLGK